MIIRATEMTEPLRKRGRSTSKDHVLFDYLIKTYNLKNNAGLAEAIGLLEPTVSRMRNKILPVSAATILAIHDATGMTIAKIKKLADQS